MSFIRKEDMFNDLCEGENRYFFIVSDLFFWKVDSFCCSNDCMFLIEI